MHKKDFGKKYFSSGSYKNYKKLADTWVPIVARRINKIIREKKAIILDVGCAHGYLIAELQNKYGYAVQGIDFSHYAVKNSDKSVWKKIKQGNILKLPYKKNQFDVVICLDVINYLGKDDVSLAIQNLARLTRGYIFFGAIFASAWTASQKLNPDKFRKSVLAKKKYIEMFEKNGVKLIQSFDGDNGGSILVFEKK